MNSRAERLSALRIGAGWTWRAHRGEVFDIEVEQSVSVMAQVVERLRHTINLIVVRTLVKRANFVEKIRNPGRCLGQIDPASLYQPGDCMGATFLITIDLDRAQG